MSNDTAARIRWSIGFDQFHFWYDLWHRRTDNLQIRQALLYWNELWKRS